MSITEYKLSKKLTLLVAAVSWTLINTVSAGSTVAITAGLYHTVALQSDGTVFTWGPHASGQNSIQVKVRAGIDDMQRVTAVSAGSWHTVAIKADSTVLAWGRNTFNQLGDGTTVNSDVPVKVRCSKEGDSKKNDYLKNIVMISAGGNHTVALCSDGKVWAWGSNRHGQLGDGTTDDSSIAIPVKDAEGHGHFSDVRFVAAGFQHTFAIKADGTVWSWGYNEKGQLGNGTLENSVSPVPAKGPNNQNQFSNVVSIAPGWDHTLMLKKDGTVWACGMGWNGLLGNGTQKDSTIFMQVKGPNGEGVLEDIVSISANWRHNLAIKNNGTVWAWGRNQDGQLGNGTNVPAAWKSDPDLNLFESFPVQVRGVGGTDYFKNTAAVAAAGEHSIGLKTDGSLFVWGSNNREQLGIGQRGHPFMRSNPTELLLLNVSQHN